MTDPRRLRNSTQIRLPRAVFEEHREGVEAEFTVTVVDEGGSVRLVGSPVEIKAVGAYLTRHGVPVE